MSNIQDAKSKICTMLLIQNDCEALKKIMMDFQNPIFFLQIIPYLALFCRSFQEYADIQLISKDIDSEIYDLRNSIKIYGERYGKSKKQFLESDEKQNDEFKNLLRFEFTKNLNIHFNLGIYFIDGMKIIGNTQLNANSLNMNDLSERERKEKSFNIGNNLGSILGSISNGMANSLTVPNILLRKDKPSIYYFDLNTNRNNFFNPLLEKDINLFMLHLLCNINFVKYILEPLFLMENMWIFRIKYIAVYHSFLGLQKLKTHLENNHKCMDNLVNEINEILANGKDLFTSKFRNCMMHYDLNYNGIFAISKVNFNEEKLFFGLIEECFNGKTYKTYNSNLTCYGEDIEKFIFRQFNFDAINLKELK